MTELVSLFLIMGDFFTSPRLLSLSVSLFRLSPQYRGHTQIHILVVDLDLGSEIALPALIINWAEVTQRICDNYIRLMNIQEQQRQQQWEEWRREERREERRGGTAIDQMVAWLLSCCCWLCFSISMLAPAFPLAQMNGQKSV